MEGLKELIKRKPSNNSENRSKRHGEKQQSVVLPQTTLRFPSPYRLSRSTAPGELRRLLLRRRRHSIFAASEGQNSCLLGLHHYSTTRFWALVLHSDINVQQHNRRLGRAFLAKMEATTYDLQQIRLEERRPQMSTKDLAGRKIVIFSSVLSQVFLVIVV